MWKCPKVKKGRSICNELILTCKQYERMAISAFNKDPQRLENLEQTRNLTPKQLHWQKTLTLTGRNLEQDKVPVYVLALPIVSQSIALLCLVSPHVFAYIHAGWNYYLWFSCPARFSTHLQLIPGQATLPISVKRPVCSSTQRPKLCCNW